MLFFYLKNSLNVGTSQFINDWELSFIDPIVIQQHGRMNKIQHLSLFSVILSILYLIIIYALHINITHILYFVYELGNIVYASALKTWNLSLTK